MIHFSRNAISKTSEVADSFDFSCPMNSSSKRTASLASYKSCDSNDDSLIENDHLSNNSMGDESILASSQQNSTLDLPSSAPSSIARNQILASSTPKEQGRGVIRGTPKIGIFPDETEEQIKENIAPKREFSDWSKDRRVVYRTQKMRNLAAPVQSFPVSLSKSTFPKKYCNLQEKLENHRNTENSDGVQVELSRESNQTRNSKIIKENIAEFILSIFITCWQLFYMTNLIPNDQKMYQILNIALNCAFAMFFMAPVRIWWYIVAASLFLYLSSAYMFGVTVSVTTFAFVSVLARALASVFQFCFLIFQ